MAQILKPKEDIAQYRFTGDPDSSDLYKNIDEGTGSYSTGSYVYGYGSNYYYETKLEAGGDPGVHTGHKFTWVYANVWGNPEYLDVQLKCGSTVIATGEIKTSSWTSTRTGSLTLSEAQSSNISDYTDLRIRFVYYSGSDNMEIYAVDFECPDAPASGSFPALLMGDF